MGQSLARNIVHLVFSTKDREPIIDNTIQAALHSYLAGICKSLECTPIEVGGDSDHVHVLCLLSKKLTLVKLLELLKSHSSKWMKTKGDSFRNFYWQDGYGAFSVSPSHVDSLIHYIKNQSEHHRQRTFKDELRELLLSHHIEYDERYVGLNPSLFQSLGIVPICFEGLCPSLSSSAPMGLALVSFNRTCSALLIVKHIASGRPFFPSNQFLSLGG